MILVCLIFNKLHLYEQEKITVPKPMKRSVVTVLMVVLTTFFGRRLVLQSIMQIKNVNDSKIARNIIWTNKLNTKKI